MRRRTGGSLLRTATSELTPLTAARLSALQQPRLPDVDEDRPGAWANQVVARSRSLYIHARRACDARTVCASTSMVPSAGDGRGASLGTPPAFDGGRAPFVPSMAGASLSLASAAPPPSSWSSSCTGARCCGGCVRLASLLPRELLNGRHGRWCTLGRLHDKGYTPALNLQNACFYER